MTTILPARARGAAVARQGRRIVGPVDLELQDGGPTVILGPNGAGKTTFLRMLHGVERLSAGRIDWALPDDEARLRRAFVFQTPTLLRRSVLDNVAFPLTLRGISSGVARDRAAPLVAEVGLAGAEARPARVLSGGERQKMALARALIVAPEVLFLDEPTASLDGRSTREIEAILTRARERGTRIVMATHDLGQARRIAGDILFIYAGRVHEAAPAEAFFEGQKTAEASAFLRGDIVE